MCGFSGYQALAYNIYQQLWLQAHFLLNLDFPNSDSIRQTYGGWREVDMQDMKKLF